ncbi:hypothetical protein M9H77_18220 [Catharanthus roseus]|uniref:Uncharacterized protein n=1 Tax=Catharanthus roseus TaxID=4058 RepID=A0ACC0B6V4_CATRO|nr:hypothetical protein M9H77_18220 [Catharanthus roseus]
MMVHLKPRDLYDMGGRGLGPEFYTLEGMGPGLGQLRLSKLPACLSALNSQRYKTKIQPGGVAAKVVVYITENFLEVENFNDADSNGSPWLH